jgi:hypothetical protein
MSNWTHVAGVIRIDAIRFPALDGCNPNQEPDWDSVFGRELNDESSYENWALADKHPEWFLPLGSEGSLHKSVWTNPRTSDLAAYTISIFGDLRDHDNPDEIIDWFQEKCQRLYVRQAIITVYNELNGTKTWNYDTDECD